MFKRLLRGLCDLIYPKNCIICQKHFSSNGPLEHLCLTCQATIEFNRPPFCLSCSRYLSDNSQNDICQKCERAVYHFDRVWAVTLYNETMKRLIHLFKYQNRTYLRRKFAQLTFTFIKNYNIDLAKYDMLIPIPLHPARLRERGYNQSQLLAEPMAREYGVKISKGNLIRTHNTKNQALLHRKERWTNIQGAFKIRNPSGVSKKSILIFDDLFTTGATVSEAARVLKEAGARNVHVLALAIANEDKVRN